MPLHALGRVPFRLLSDRDLQQTGSAGTSEAAKLAASVTQSVQMPAQHMPGSASPNLHTLHPQTPVKDLVIHHAAASKVPKLRGSARTVAA
jgi:hypothetical protein